MLRHLIAENKLEMAFNERGVSEQDIVFVQEMIAGPIHGEVPAGLITQSRCVYMCICGCGCEHMRVCTERAC